MGEETEPFRVEIINAVARVTIDREPRRNAMTLAMWGALAEIIEGAGRDRAVSAIVLTGAGETAFSAGADISEFQTVRASRESVATYDAANERAFAALREAPKPVIARINGFCLGGGLGLALACDVRIATPVSTFAIPAARLGIGYPVPWVADLLNAVRPSTARDMLFTARRLDAAEALEKGLVDRVVPVDALDEAIGDMTTMISNNAPLSLAAAKTAIHALTRPDGDKAKAEAAIEAAFASNDYKEGRAAFMEKRKPVFKGN